MSRLPVTVLTGFLGSGKTTLLQRLLTEDGGKGAAVLINEFGAVGLDHLLVRPMTVPAVVLQNGCICCSVRSDLKSGLRDLLDARDRGDIPTFDRVLVETTGLADPVPIVQTLTADPMLRHQFRLANLVTTIDVLHAAGQIGSYREALRQAALADRLALTKTDIASPEVVDLVRQRISAVNPAAPVIDTHASEALWDALLGTDASNPDRMADEARIWLSRVPADPAPVFEFSDTGDASSHVMRSFAVRFEQEMDWTAFAVWLSAMVHRHGSRLLRIKGLLNVPGSTGPILLNAVQNFIHPPQHLDQWPDQDRSSRLVFIVEGLEPEKVRRSLLAFVESAAQQPAQRQGVQ
ncbi:GTP-binding protein [Aestuariivirga sp.]|uniref:CobW family GTP-binding protein n=1 Tax=Aestuariivirga sp. TaxID=2650926 RepID=UPI00301AE82A